MMGLDVVFGILVSVIISAILFAIRRVRWKNIGLFYLIVFITALTVGVWGFPLLGSYWLPAIIAALSLALLLTSAFPVELSEDEKKDTGYREHNPFLKQTVENLKFLREKETDITAQKSVKQVGATITGYVWIFLALMSLAVVLEYLI